MTSVRKSSKSSGQKSNAGETSRQSQLTIFDALSPASLQEVSHAKIFPSQGSKRALPKAKNLPCGGRCGELSKHSDLTMCSWRMSLLCELMALTPYSLQWKHLITPAGRSWWVLGQSAHPTKETESSSRPSMYGFGNVDHSGKVNGGCELATAARHPEKLVGGKVRLNQENWQTPKVSTSTYTYDGGDHSKPRPSLPLQVQNWATPRASENENRQTNPTPSQLAGTHGMNLATQVNWQTPAAGDFRSGGCQADMKRKSPNLPTQALYPTPTATPYGSNQGGSSGRVGPKRGSLSQVAQESPNANGKRTGSLNFRWVAQLMGVPVDWFDLKPDTETKRSKR